MNKINDEIKIFAIFVILLFVYIVFVQIWQFSSPNYPPTNFVDSLPRKEIDPKIWVNYRNAHGKTDWYITGNPEL